MVCKTYCSGRLKVYAGQVCWLLDSFVVTSSLPSAVVQPVCLGPHKTIELLDLSSQAAHILADMATGRFKDEHPLGNATLSNAACAILQLS